MQPASRHPDETRRLAALQGLSILDTPSEQAFDDLVKIASALCGTPIALVSFVDEHRQWFKAKFGLDASETPRDLAFCAHAILVSDSMLVVNNAFDDQRFHDNPLVTGDPHVVFYAGVPLKDPETKLPLGTLCVIDNHARSLSPAQLRGLMALGRLAETQLRLHRQSHVLTEALAKLHDIGVPGIKPIPTE